MIDRHVDISQTGKVWIVLAATTVLSFTLWQLVTTISGGSWKVVALVVAFFAAFFVAGKIAGDWRSGVYYFLSWLLFEDLIRKYMGNNMAVYFVKDVLVAVTYASFVVSRINERGKPFHPPFRFALGAFFLLGLVQIFNPLSPSIFYGLLGMKIYFYYVPLMFVGYAMFEDERDLPRFFAFNMGLAGVIAWVGIMQTIVGMGFLNPMGGEDIDALGHMVRYTHGGQAVPRAPGVFVSEGRFGSYMIIAFLIGLAGAGYLLLRTKRGRAFVFPGLGLVTLGAIMTGSRGAVVYLSASAVLLSAAMLWGAPRGRLGGMRLVKAIRRSFVFIAVAVFLLAAIFPNVVLPRLTLYRETLTPGSEYSELGQRTWTYPLLELKQTLSDRDWLIGHGIGTVSLGVQYVSRILDVPRAPLGCENGFGALILEFGILGPILWLLWALSLLATGLNTALKLRGTWAFPIAIAVVWYAFVLPFPLTWGGIAPYQNFVINAYFWLFVGILFKLPELVKQSAENLPAGAACNA
jgi:hypothetical protein